MCDTPYIVFWGTPALTLPVLDTLRDRGLTPHLIITAPDARAGRGMRVTPPPAKTWAERHGVETLQPEKIRRAFSRQLAARIPAERTLFVVFAYGKILPAHLLAIPRHGTLNLHPSLLPRLRGPSPIRSAILYDERDTGVSVILMNERMDAGPLVAQRRVPVSDWPPHGRDLDELLVREGATLLADTIPAWISGDILPEPQDETRATYCSLFSKEDGLIDPARDDPYQSLLKIRAFEGWPGTYFFHGDTRVRIVDADMAEDGSLRIRTVIPAGGKALPYEEFLKRARAH